MKSLQTVFVSTFTNGILGPDVQMAGLVKDGGFIVSNTAPGCWGPMITPAIRGGHEVTTPVLVEGAEIGDAIAIYIKSVEVTSFVTASGVDSAVAGCFNGDPFVAGVCPGCGETYPETKTEGIGFKSVKCANCGADASPFAISNGYTIAFDQMKKVGVTLDKAAAEKAAENAREYMSIPDNSIQNPIVTFAPSDMPGVVTRLRPFLGQLGTTPPRNFPDSHNAGDFGSFLVGAPHEYGIKEDELADRTDGHLDINRVRPGAVLICPVKIAGGGVYIGDAHAMQGDGEIAGHTCDISAAVTLQVKVIKGLRIDGPILLPVKEDLPYLAKPFGEDEWAMATAEARKWGVAELEKTAPISFIGTGANLNAAIDNGLSRAADVLCISVDEIKNRVTITGAIEIGRAPGTVTITFLAPYRALENAGLLELVKEQYCL